MCDNSKCVYSYRECRQSCASKHNTRETCVEDASCRWSDVTLACGDVSCGRQQKTKSDPYPWGIRWNCSGSCFLADGHCNRHCADIQGKIACLSLPYCGWNDGAATGSRSGGGVCFPNCAQKERSNCGKGGVCVWSVSENQCVADCSIHSGDEKTCVAQPVCRWINGTAFPPRGN